MKNFKTIMGLLMAMIMTLSMSIVSLADTTYTITIDNGSKGHTYEAYQIFTGDLSNSTLSNIVWGNGVSEDGKTALGDASTKAAAITDAAAFAEEVAPYLSTVAGSVSPTEDGSCTITGLTAGYYLIKDKDNSLGEVVPSAYTSYILKIVKDTNVTLKTDTPEVTKKVKDTNDSTSTDSDWQDSADYDIGDKVPFQLTATLADNVSSYDTYKVVFHDTLSTGLTFNNDVTVKLGDSVVEATNYTVATNGNALTITFADVKSFGATNSSVITVDYTATLNTNAVVGSAGNPNKVHLEYSNNPNSGGEGDTGKTPDDTVVVFTYKVVLNKTDSSNNPLPKAGFSLYKKDADKFATADDADKLAEGEGFKENYVLVEKIDPADNKTQFTFSGLDDGDYILVESATPAGYNTIKPIAFTITADHDVLSDNPALTALNGTPEVADAIAFTSSLEEGSLTSDVVNKSGSELPETGGMGTRVLYLLGGLLVIVAMVLLVTKKRMSNN